MLKENNERGVRMMFLSLEQLQKLKLNPTRADYEIAYETEVKEQEGTALNVSEIMEGLYERLNRPDRPNRKTMRSMSVGDIIQIDGKELFFCDSGNILEGLLQHLPCFLHYIVDLPLPIPGSLSPAK